MSQIWKFEPTLQKLTTISYTHFTQLLSHLLTSNLFQTRPSFRSPIIFLSSSISPTLPSTLIHLTHHPLTNDFNSLLRSLSLSPTPLPTLIAYTHFISISNKPLIRPDALSLSFVLRACSRLSLLSPSQQLHAHVFHFGCNADVILYTTLLDAYAKSGRLDFAQQVFEEMSVRDIATWNAIIVGFSGGNRANEALGLFWKVAREGKVNGITVVGALSACAQLGALRDGEAVEGVARRDGLVGDVRVGNALIDMYGKCGAVERAEAVFWGMGERSLVSWNAFLMAFAMHGRGDRVLELFEEMVGVGRVEPDGVTYLAVLCGCMHSGLVDEGLRVFRSMRVVPNVKHYGSIVDLLGRAGRLSEAYEIIMSMPGDIEPDIVLWQTLLGACKMHGHVELAEYVSNKLHEMGSNGCGDYVLLSNVYAAKERWNDVGRVREAMVKNDVRKVPGFSYIEVDGVVHKFLNGDKELERWKEIYRKLDEIGAKITVLGYVPDISNVLHDIGDEDKETALYHHSEKLAIAFGLISTPEGTSLHVIKNLRICRDCHTMAKLISKAYDRVIIIRDRSRYHQFEGGECSCRDYW